MSIVNVEHLTKRYGDTVAVADVSFAVQEGEIFGLLGPNGAGKTTTVECLAGLRERDGGSVSVLGLDPGDPHTRPRLREQLGMQLQAADLPPRLRVGEALALYSSFYAQPADWRELAEVLGLQSKLETRFDKLSGGQRQRLSAALALVGAPRIAILDELTTGLDPSARRDTWLLVERIRDERGVTVLLVTHFMEEAERLCDRVAVVDAGRIVAIDTPRGLAEQAEGETRLAFVPSAPVDEDVLRAVPGVTAVARDDAGRVVVTGSGDVAGPVVAALAHAGAVAHHLRVEQADLEDAFVALTAGGNIDA